MTENLQEKRLNAVASQLAHIIKSQGDENNDIIRTSLEELVNVSSFTPDECKRIMSRAIHLMSEESNSTTTDIAKKAVTASFSLWDQLATPFSERVFWKHIEEAPNETEKLERLKKVDHIDDILPDWIRVCKVLQNGLQSQAKQKLEYVTLSKKWFQQCQATPEYQNVRTDLCDTLLEAFRNTSVSGGGETHKTDDDASEMKIEHVFFSQLLQTWKFLWISIIKSRVYDEENLDSMVSKTLLLMQTTSSAEEEELLPVQWLALIDPDMDWLRFWLDESSVPRILAVLSTIPSTISEIWQRCRSHGAKQNTSILLSKTQWETLIYRQSLATLSLLLIQLRVCMFPWDFMDNLTIKNNLTQPIKLSTKKIFFQPHSCSEKPKWVIQELELGAKAFPTNKKLQLYFEQALESLAITPP